jgi:NAD(P)-dependent dehydrogenase (short-subunit alcohol dehydrogenase family)
MPNVLDKKVAVVTGGSRGIGLAIAEAFLREGASVVISGSSKDHLDAATKILSSYSGRVSAVQADVRRYEEVERLMATAARDFGGLDILINNAGVGVFKPVAETTVEEWHRVLDTNLSGVFYGCHAAIPHMKRRGGGWIINISSLASKKRVRQRRRYCCVEIRAERVLGNADAGRPATTAFASRMCFRAPVNTAFERPLEYQVGMGDDA